jgi:hypothetical protein
VASEYSNWLDGPGFTFWEDQGIFSPRSLPDRLRGQPASSSMHIRSRGKSGRGVKVINNVILVPGLRIYYLVILSWRGQGQLWTGTTGVNRDKCGQGQLAWKGTIVDRNNWRG